MPKDVMIQIDAKLLKDAKLLDAISSALEDNESSPRLTKMEEKLEDDVITEMM